MSEIKADFLIGFLKRLGFQFFVVEPTIENGVVTKYNIRIILKAEEVEKLKKIA